MSAILSSSNSLIGTSAAVAGVEGAPPFANSIASAPTRFESTVFRSCFSTHQKYCQWLVRGMRGAARVVASGICLSLAPTRCCRQCTGGWLPIPRLAKRALTQRTCTSFISFGCLACCCSCCSEYASTQPPFRHSNLCMCFQLFALFLRCHVVGVARN